jgi:chromosome segregation ATPase
MEETKTVVKETAKDSTPKATPEAKGDTTVKVEASKEDVVENRSIPYERFKEKTLEVKELKKQIDAIKAEADAKVQDTARQYQTYYESELAKLQRQNQDAYNYGSTNEQESAYTEKISGLTKEIENLRAGLSTLKEESELTRLNTSVSKLKDVYPSLDEEHVFAVKKLKPTWSLEECAEYSHQHFENAVKMRLDKMMEKKKEAAKRPVMGDIGLVNIKPEERPKDFKEAKKRFLEHFKTLGQ